MKINKALAIAGTMFAACAFSSSANALAVNGLILETVANFDDPGQFVSHNLTKDLVQTQQGGGACNSIECMGIAQALNEGLELDGKDAYTGIDAIAKFEVTNFNNDGTVALSLGPGNEGFDPLNSGNLGIFNPGQTIIDLTFVDTNEGRVYTWDLVQRPTDWNIVKIGLKAGNTLAYFLVSPEGEGADTGAFNLSALASAYTNQSYCTDGFDGDNPPCSGDFDTGPLDAWLNDPELSHVVFLGEPGQKVPEPSAIALLGIGLFGIGYAARRRKAA